jgi:sugar O-acyltransferase (sialic acid O-acetyltransferase NeuD family)
MTSLIPLKVPLLNTNEKEALLVSLLVNEGQPVKAGQTVAVVETTKSTGEMVAEEAGFLVGLRFAEGETVEAGEVLGYIGGSPDARDDTLPPWQKTEGSLSDEDHLVGLRITNPARALALEKGLDVQRLPQGKLITRKVVEGLLRGGDSPIESLSRVVDHDGRVVIYGAGGHGRSLAALITAGEKFQVVGFVDDGLDSGDFVAGLPVLGGRKDLEALYESDVALAVNGVGGIGRPEDRLAIFYQLADAGFICPTVIHPTAFLEKSARLMSGVQVFPLAYVGTDVRVGFGSIINTGAIVSHDVDLAPYVNLSPGATLAGGVVVGEGVLVGMRATVNLGVHIGAHAAIGNGATVKADVPEGGVVPAGTIWPPRHP